MSMEHHARVLHACARPMLTLAVSQH